MENIYNVLVEIQKLIAASGDANKFQVVGRVLAEVIELIEPAAKAEIAAKPPAA